ncbi:30S ribosomal protein S20 [Pseudothermotoga thermarum]|uniref:Small ribosomal subunit protein bS20 n=1 Tax=Pseudothermotoga thermarum DSM 5069 TaxID=688269 RepID=F7YXS0_9THEM|nr:30S ribosomal protein S20 [Pseudothermotoga thermarum]AEH50714.1 SSU ribosomal protein S20P [Pseudothermotoga thermarum DSM 5069]
MPGKKKNKSAEKRHRQSLKARVRNKSYITRMKNAVKKVLQAVKAGESKEKIDELVKQAISVIDKAASKGAIHKNQAARRKSRLMKVVNSAVKV